ncbi:MAG: aspartate-semialdehyde dehydrogenase [Gemmatimonadota bacterium]
MMRYQPRERIPVAILGATGAVGQTFIRLLDDHPWFRVTEVAASERSAGKPYRDAARWIEGPLPDRVASLEVVPTVPSAVDSKIVFSALDSSVAGEIEQDFARAGRIVLSNAKNHRMEPDVPLVIPEINVAHLDLIDHQRRVRGWSGCIVTNSNCAAATAVMPLAPLHQTFGVSRILVATMQAVSGAGYPGVPSLDILGNIIPYIGDEEPKIEREMNKILGLLTGGAIEPASFTVSAHANRVPVENGHMACLSIGFDRRAGAEEAIEVLRAWRACPEAQGLPSSPEQPLVVVDAPDRPQTRRDVQAGRGMTVTVGRVRPDPVLDIKLVALGHNTIRGAAGGSILNAEVLVARGIVR